MGRLVYQNEIARRRREQRVAELMEEKGIRPDGWSQEVQDQVDAEERTKVQMQRIAHGIKLPPARGELPCERVSHYACGGLPEGVLLDESAEGRALHGRTLEVFTEADVAWREEQDDPLHGDEPLPPPALEVEEAF